FLRPGRRNRQRNRHDDGHWPLDGRAACHGLRGCQGHGGLVAGGLLRRVHPDELVTSDGARPALALGLAWDEELDRAVSGLYRPGIAMRLHAGRLVTKSHGVTSSMD